MLANPSHLRCPVCRYDLHGLGGPRCPECGTIVNLAALMRSRRSSVETYYLRLALMAAGVLLAVPIGISIIGFVQEISHRQSIDVALASMPDAARVTVFAPPYWPPSAILLSVVAAIAIGLFAAALTARRRWYLAVLGVLMVDAAWIFSIWCGVQVVMNI